MAFVATEQKFRDSKISRIKPLPLAQVRAENDASIKFHQFNKYLNKKHLYKKFDEEQDTLSNHEILS